MPQVLQDVSQVSDVRGQLLGRVGRQGPDAQGRRLVGFAGGPGHAGKQEVGRVLALGLQQAGAIGEDALLDCENGRDD